MVSTNMYFYTQVLQRQFVNYKIPNTDKDFTTIHWFGDYFDVCLFLIIGDFVILSMPFIVCFFSIAKMFIYIILFNLWRAPFPRFRDLIYWCPKIMWNCSYLSLFAVGVWIAARLALLGPLVQSVPAAEWSDVHLLRKQSARRAASASGSDTIVN